MIMSSEVATLKPDTFETDDFVERLSATIDAGAQCVMISIGHRSGLFDCMATLAPATSAEIASAAGLNERFVREWLAVMVVARIVRYDAEIALYHLPAAHAASLTRQATPGNMAVYAQIIPLMGAIQEQLLECLRTGEGTSYSDYPCFHQFMSEDSMQTVVARLFDSVLPLVDGLHWKLSSGIDVLDAGCGRGEAIHAMALRYPKSRFTGYDLCADAIHYAESKAREAGLRNLRFEACDLSHLHEASCYDFITTFDAVHDQKDPRDLLRRLHRALRPDGVYLMQDIGGSTRLENNLDFPMASLLYAVSFSHCTPVSIGQGGKGLGTMWGWEQAEEMLRSVGFPSIRRHVLEHDPMNVWFVNHKEV
jgi:2-polyprenyl-3-methyl-5-hydroxy-6-metoxy-1,4-benzoquinol methylase